MHTGNPIQQRNENPNYVAYFYDSGIIQRYLANKSQALIDLNTRPTAPYDFSSDLVGQKGFHQPPTVEQIIARGYLAVARSDPVEAIISDKKDTSWLGLDDVISQIRGRYELYHRNMY
ncbi:MAG: hypothetical protein ACYTAS_16980, partial [Planctomycetota bacterium]